MPAGLPCYPGREVEYLYASAVLGIHHWLGDCRVGAGFVHFFEFILKIASYGFFPTEVSGSNAESNTTSI